MDPIGYEVLVPPGHPWAGLLGVIVRPSAAVVVNETVDSLVHALAPVVMACRGLAKVSQRGLWDQVSDSFGTALTHDLELSVTRAMIGRVESALHAPGAPWKTTPDLRLAPAQVGRVHVAQRGSCCLSCTAQPKRTGSLEPVEPSYCSLRDRQDCERETVEWYESQACSAQRPGP